MHRVHDVRCMMHAHDSHVPLLCESSLVSRGCNPSRRHATTMQGAWSGRKVVLRRDMFLAGFVSLFLPSLFIHQLYTGVKTHLIPV